MNIENGVINYSFFKRFISAYDGIVCREHEKLLELFVGQNQPFENIEGLLPSILDFFKNHEACLDQGDIFFKERKRIW